MQTLHFYRHLLGIRCHAAEALSFPHSRCAAVQASSALNWPQLKSRPCAHLCAHFGPAEHAFTQQAMEVVDACLTYSHLETLTYTSPGRPLLASPWHCSVALWSPPKRLDRRARRPRPNPRSPHPPPLYDRALDSPVGAAESRPGARSGAPPMQASLRCRILTISARQGKPRAHLECRAWRQ